MDRTPPPSKSLRVRGSHALGYLRSAVLYKMVVRELKEGECAAKDMCGLVELSGYEALLAVDRQEFGEYLAAKRVVS
jgi:hypothetical protein